jgi:hypothetical protein
MHNRGVDAALQHQSRASAVSAPLGLRLGFWVCVVIAAAVVIRRVAAFAAPSSSGPPELLALDQTFRSHAGLTLAHIVPAFLFVVLAPTVLVWNVRRAEPWLFAMGAITGFTAFAMSAYSIGGWLERSAVFLFDTLFLFSLWRAWMQNTGTTERRRWLVRAIVILLGIATTRPVMGMFFATSRLTHLGPSQFFGIAFWIGFSINLIVVELWLRRRRNYE